MTKNVLWAGLTLCLFASLPAAGADAQAGRDNTVAPIVATTAGGREMPVATAVQATPPTAANRVTPPVSLPTDSTPQPSVTQSQLPLIALVGLALLIGAVGVMVYNRRAIP